MGTMYPPGDLASMAKQYGRLQKEEAAKKLNQAALLLLADDEERAKQLIIETFTRYF
jgi:hypothetical protein